MHEPSPPVEPLFRTDAEPSSPQTDAGAITEPAFAPWPLSLRVAFRFCFVYFGLFCLTTQIFPSMFSFPHINIPELDQTWPLRQIITWTATHVFHIHRDLVFTDSGSGDKTVDRILILILAIAAVVAAVIWSGLDRKRTEYSKLHAYFRLFIRFAVAGQMLLYGLDKVFPLQMSYPGFARLLEPFGSFSQMGVLWSSIGAAPAYEIFGGCAELSAGILLLIPRTTLLGALVAMADMTQVFMLNMTYDVPVKILSFHLLLMAVFLLAPDLPRLSRLLFGTTSVPAPTPSPIFRSRRAARIALAVQLLYGAALLGFGIHDAWKGWHEYGGAAPTPALYGIWDVEEFSMDGQLRQPLITDKDRWRRLTFDRGGYGGLQLMDDTITFFSPEINATEHVLVLSRRRTKNWQAKFSFEQPAPDRLTLDGELNTHKIQAKLHLADVSKEFQLRSAKFHWINEYPVNR